MYNIVTIYKRVMQTCCLGVRVRSYELHRDHEHLIKCAEHVKRLLHDEFETHVYQVNKVIVMKQILYLWQTHVLVHIYAHFR